MVIFWFIYMKNLEQFRLNFFKKDKAKSSNYKGEKKTYSTKGRKKTTISVFMFSC